jgi:hypothetical protein
MLTVVFVLPIYELLKNMAFSQTGLEIAILFYFQLFESSTSSTRKSPLPIYWLVWNMGNFRKGKQSFLLPGRLNWF